MAVFELTLALLLGGVLLSILAPRLGVPWPALLALFGATLAFVPGVPVVTLDPDLALALFVAPVLLDAAFDASPRDLRDNWVPVGSLVLVAVGLTVVAVAATARWLVPSMPWAAALALGAIVAPPDAAAAITVLRQVRLPHRLMVILEGEGLLNDASALLVYRVAVGAAAGGITAWTFPLVVGAAIGGVLLGYGLARAWLFVTRRPLHGPEATVLQFLATFGAWLLADALGLSAVLCMVAYAVTLSRQAAVRMGARDRRSTYAVWDVAVFVLNVLAFILVGLQLRGILQHLAGGALRYGGFALAVLAVVVVVRFAWVMTLNTVVRVWDRRHPAQAADGRPLLRPTLGGGVAIAWCGMRGIVTLAAALALPDGFPQRDLIVFAAFCTVLGTLVLQGMTARALLSWLDLPKDSTLDEELATARQEMAEAGLAVLQELDGPERDGVAGRYIRRKYEVRVEADAGETDPTGIRALRQRALGAERDRLLRLRRTGRIGDATFHRVQEELDWSEADLDTGEEA